MNPLSLKKLSGNEILPYIHDLAQLRIKLFREYPYLYDGDMEYEKEYLQTYADCPRSKILLVLDGDQVVGASTAIPLVDETSEFKQHFINNHLNINKYFYLGEVILLPEYRGQGICRKFFNFFEQAAKEQNYKKTIFMTVVRPKNHPLQPIDYQQPDTMWQHFGYVAHPQLIVYFPWKEIHKMAITDNPLMLWIKNL